MAVPTHRLRQFDGSEATTAFNTEAQRKGSLTGDATVNFGSPPSGGAPLDFGTVDISGGAANSGVVNIRWDVTADGGNTAVSDFKLWILPADFGFTGGTTDTKFQAISGSDQGSPSLTENYVQNAVVGSYTWATVPTSEPGSINLYPTDEGSSMVLSTTSDDAICWANYLAVDAAEVTGTYEAATSGKEFRFSYAFSYS